MAPSDLSLRQRLMSLDVDALSDRELVAAALLAIALLSALAWALLSVLVPAPPKEIALTGGPASGAYHARAGRFAQALQRDGVSVRVQVSRGTPENLERLRAAQAQAGFVQGGIADLARMPGLESLARLGHEPVWVFHRRGIEPRTLGGLKGLRISIGVAGGGTQPVARALLQASGIDERNATLQALNNDEALDELAAGRLDAMFAVAAWDAPVIQRALNAGHGLLSIAQAMALSRQFPWLTALVLPRGGLSLARDEPPADVELLAVSTELVARADLHPATKALLRRVALEDQRGLPPPPLLRSTALAAAESLPDGSEVASTFLQQHLPFWWADLLHRLSLSVLPVLLVALPGLNALVAFRQRRNHSRILRLFAQAKELQLRMLREPRPSGQLRKELLRLERELQRLSPQVVHMVDYYRLRTTLATLDRGIETGALPQHRPLPGLHLG
jgi:hypothetical protein